MCVSLYACKKLTYCDTQVKDPVVHVRVQWITEIPNNPACAKLTVVRVFKLDITQEKRRCFVVSAVSTKKKWEAEPVQGEIVLTVFNRP